MLQQNILFSKFVLTTTMSVDGITMYYVHNKECNNEIAMKMIIKPETGAKQTVDVVTNYPDYQGTRTYFSFVNATVTTSETKRYRKFDDIETVLKKVSNPNPYIVLLNGKVRCSVCCMPHSPHVIGYWNSGNKVPLYWTTNGHVICNFCTGNFPELFPLIAREIKTTDEKFCSFLIDDFPKDKLIFIDVTYPLAVYNYLETCHKEQNGGRTCFPEKKNGIAKEIVGKLSYRFDGNTKLYDDSRTKVLYMKMNSETKEVTEINTSIYVDKINAILPTYFGNGIPVAHITSLF